jgi:predicted  nucleic acid-binding Zn-ribbon protein
MCNVIADHVREITEKNAEIAELRYSLSQAHSVAQACAARAERAEANAANWEEQANDRVSDWDEVRAERDALKLRLAAVEDMNAACNADFSRLRAERDALRAALIEATEMVEHWGGYASDYFREKWDLEGDLTKLRAAIAAESQS